MALSAELNSLKSAGTYRFERDLSTISNDTTTYSNLRLVVGFSKTGPFNTPMLITNQSQFISLFGNIDRSLEKRGSYFHRSALVALSAGPILALNLLNPDQDLDQVPQRGFSISPVECNKNIVTLPLASLYNTDKFWFASDECYLDAIDKYIDSNDSVKTLLYGNTAKDSETILNFANVGKKSISILVKKASSYATTNYECTLKTWYGEGSVPEYLNPTSYVSDYMVEVHVIAGDFGPALKKSTGVPTNLNLDDDAEDEMLYRFDPVNALTTSDESYNKNPYARFTSDVTYQKYFDKRGFIRRDRSTDSLDAKLNEFENLASVNLVAKYVGSLIPNFCDKFGRNIWIQKLINDDTNSTGLLCAENVALIEDVDIDADVINEKIDVIGNNIHSIIKNATGSVNYNFLSYEGSIATSEQKIKILVDPADSEDPVEVTYKRYTNGDKKSNKDFLQAPFCWKRDDVANASVTVPANAPANVYTSESSYTALKAASKVYAFSKENTSADDSIPYAISTVDEYNPMSIEIAAVQGANGKVPYTKVLTTDSDGKIQKTFGINELYTSMNGTERVHKDDEDYRTNEIIVPLSADIVAGDYLLSSYNEVKDDEGQTKDQYSRLTRVVEVRGVYASVDTAASKLTKVGMRVICADEILVENDRAYMYQTADQFCDRLQWTCLKGFKVRDELMPNGTEERQNQILDMLRENPEYTGTKSNLYKTLCDRDYIQWRYLVDTFGLGLEESCKDVYTLLCQGRQSAFALVNCPSQLDFKKSIDPSFVNERGAVEAEYIAEGGNLDKTPAFLFSLPKQEKGGSWGAYFYPYLKISDLSAPKSVPPAAYVSNLYLAKYGNGNAWSIVAGQRRGVISGNQVIGVEATLVHDNRDWLEPVGINSIIWENGVGVEIYANKTAKQTPKSALSSIHVREACIYIQDNVESILRKYVFEMNTAQVRLEIKTLVDNFMESIKADGGIYAYRTIMDTSNNTQEVIDNNMGVIDIYIEPVRGLEILTQRLTVMKTGGIAAGAFE